ncbi:MAG: thiamine-phosphate kinase [Phycisphaeraceae bacterium]
MREFELIRSIVAYNGDLPEAVSIPPGDDMAALRLGEIELLVAVDQAIEGVHFDRVSASLEQIGRKAVTRNLSDVAAMAAVPLATLVSAVLPKGFKEADAEMLLAAVRETAKAYGAPLIGGDTATCDERMSLSVTALAVADGVEPVTRDGASPGDAIYVTGQLGGSLHAYNGTTHHLDFEPRLKVARQLAADPATRPKAMIDLSDGLARDLPHLVSSAEIRGHLLPVSPVARQFALRSGRPGWLHAVADGEDYELLLIADAGASLPASIDGVPITRIGVVTDGPGIVLLNGNERVAIDGLGWEHHG